MLLVMIKIKLGLMNRDLSDRFGISEGTVSNIFNTYVKIMSRLLKISYPLA